MDVGVGGEANAHTEMYKYLFELLYHSGLAVVKIGRTLLSALAALEITWPINCRLKKKGPQALQGQ